MLADHVKIRFNQYEVLVALTHDLPISQCAGMAGPPLQCCLENTRLMMILMVSTALASLAMGVTIAYALCNALFALFKMHGRARSFNPVPVEAKTTH